MPMMPPPADPLRTYASPGMGYAFGAAGALVRWVARVMTPDLRGQRPGGLGPTGAQLQNFFSFVVVWLITFRLAGLTVGSVVAPWYAVVASGPWYAIALIIGWLALVAINPTGSRREMVHRLTKALPALALVIALFALTLLLVDRGNGWVNSVAGDGADMGQIGRILLGLVLALLQIVVFVALAIALVTALWYGAQHRFCAGAVHPLLPATVDLVVAAILVASTIIALTQTGAGVGQAVDLGSAAVLVVFAGVDLVLLSRPDP